MSVVRSNRLAQGSASVLAEQVVLTVPAGHRYLLKHASVYNNTSGSHAVTMGVQVAGVDYWVTDTVNLASGLTLQLHDEVVLGAGDKLVFYAGSTMASIWYASGIDFTL